MIIFFIPVWKIAILIEQNNCVYSIGMRNKVLSQAEY